MRGKFFAIGKPQWTAACKLGLNPAVAFLVLACGTGRDNVTTRWSAEAVRKYSGMAWTRANDALNQLAGNPQIISSVSANGKLRLRKLVIPEHVDSLLWLPSALVTGARDETPPVARLRQTQNLEHLQTFIELYGAQNLAADGGLPRCLVQEPFTRTRVCERGPFTVYGFDRADACAYTDREPLVRFDSREDGSGSVWDFLVSMDDLGLLETVDHLAESDSPDAELLHALSGDTYAEAVATAAAVFASELPGGFEYDAENFDYVIPVLRRIANPAVVGVTRLVYRAHTTLTTTWFAGHRDACEAYAQRYRALSIGDFDRAARAG